MPKEQEKKTSEFWSVEKKITEDVEAIKQRPTKLGLLVGLLVALLLIGGTVTFSDIFETKDEEPDFFLIGGTAALLFGCCFGMITRALTMFCCNPFKTKDTTETYINKYLEKLFVTDQLKFSAEEIAKYFPEAQNIINKNSIGTQVILNDQQVKILTEKFCEATKKIDENAPLLINP